MLLLGIQFQRWRPLKLEVEVSGAALFEAFCKRGGPESCLDVSCQ